MYTNQFKDTRNRVFFVFFLTSFQDDGLQLYQKYIPLQAFSKYFPLYKYSFKGNVNILRSSKCQSTFK